MIPMPSGVQVSQRATAGSAAALELEEDGGQACGLRTTRGPSIEHHAAVFTVWILIKVVATSSTSSAHVGRFCQHAAPLPRQGPRSGLFLRNTDKPRER
jgi:hypothetical protein